MLDIKFIREHVQEVKDNLIHRHNSFDLDEVLDLDSRRRNLLQETEQLKKQRNEATRQIAEAKRSGQDSAEKIAEMKGISQKISELDRQLSETESILRDGLLHLPNMCDASVPVGKDDSENPEVRRWGDIPAFRSCEGPR
mgnify:FL=1